MTKDEIADLKQFIATTVENVIETEISKLRIDIYREVGLLHKKIDHMESRLNKRLAAIDKKLDRKINQLSDMVFRCTRELPT